MLHNTYVLIRTVSTRWPGWPRPWSRWPCRTRHCRAIWTLPVTMVTTARRRMVTSRCIYVTTSRVSSCVDPGVEEGTQFCTISIRLRQASNDTSINFSIKVTSWFTLLYRHYQHDHCQDDNTIQYYRHRADSMFAPSQWQTPLLCNGVSHWLGVSIESASWRHQMETFSALLSLCAGNSPATGEFPSQRPVTRSFDIFFGLRLNKRLSKKSWGWWSQTPSRHLSSL